MKNFTLLKAMAIVALTGGALVGNVYAQTSTAVKESGKAIAEKAKEGKETVHSAVTSEPKKSAHKAKARAHKAKAAMHDSNAKAAGDKIGK